MLRIFLAIVSMSAFWKRKHLVALCQWRTTIDRWHFKVGFVLFCTHSQSMTRTERIVVISQRIPNYLCVLSPLQFFFDTFAGSPQRLIEIGTLEGGKVAARGWAYIRRARSREVIVHILSLHNSAGVREPVVTHAVKRGMKRPRHI